VLIPEWAEGIYINEEMILSLGFKPLQEDKEWPYTMIYSKDNLTLQYINPWGQGNMDEGWLLKKDGVEVPFRGRRKTLFGTRPNGYILFLDDLKKLIDVK
jgi:hypothetical protein